MVFTSGVWTSSTGSRDIRLLTLRRFYDLGLLQICRILTGAAEGDRILPGVGHHHEFMGIASADASRIRLHRTEIQTATGEDPL